MDVILLFPGQGSQKPGMGKDLAAAFPSARSAFDTVDRAVGASVSALAFEGPPDQLTLTLNAQPALLAHGAAIWSVMRERASVTVRAAAGHSLGEFTAYWAAGSLNLERAAKLVRRRGELMYETGIKVPGAMAAILGELRVPIETLCAQASTETGTVVPANYNDAAQIVISGEVNGVERAMVLAKEAGAKRAVRLNVSGAFHSPLMEPAVQGLSEALQASELGDPSFPVYSNVTTKPCSRAMIAAELLLRQLTAPVRWTGLVQRMVADHPDALFVEMGPGVVLASLVRRIAPEAQVMSCGTTAELDAVLEKLAT
jgi:[acyl-carrier-protein] S-malonyltransferase